MVRIVQDFLSRKSNLNILQFVVTLTLSYILLTRFSMVEALLVMSLVVGLCIVIRIKSIADGMMYVTEDPEVEKWINIIDKMNEKDKKKKKD